MEFLHSSRDKDKMKVVGQWLNRKGKETSTVLLSTSREPTDNIGGEQLTPLYVGEATFINVVGLLREEMEIIV